MNFVINDLLYFPYWGKGIYYVWRRNFLYFRYTLLAAASWMFMEPLLYLSALGYGLGRFVSEVDGQSYAEFIAPAMMATTGMMVSFFDAAYGTFTKLARQNTYHTIILTPVSTDEVTLAEIIWCASKGFLSSVAVSFVVVLLGLAPIENIFPTFLILALTCTLFGALGVFFATLAKSYDWFIFAQSGLIIPMSLFCGTYFPLSELPMGGQMFAYLFPLTHTIESTRMFLRGEFSAQFFINLSYLILVTTALTNMASARMRRKLISKIVSKNTINNLFGLHI
jgi:lipooligosaccharide transport system permease protein